MASDEQYDPDTVYGERRQSDSCSCPPSHLSSLTLGLWFLPQPPASSFRLPVSSADSATSFITLSRRRCTPTASHYSTLRASRCDNSICVQDDFNDGNKKTFLYPKGNCYSQQMKNKLTTHINSSSIFTITLGSLWINPNIALALLVFLC